MQATNSNQTSTPKSNPNPTSDSRPVKDEAVEKLQDVRRDVEDLVGRATDEMNQFSEAAKEYGASFAQRRKAGTADTISEIAGTLRETGSRLEDSPNLMSMVNNAAESLDDIAGKIRNRSFGDLYRDAEDFARERPMTVAAGAAIVGLVAARFLKSSGDRARARRDWEYDRDHAARRDW